MFGSFLPNYMMNNTILPWSAELGFMGDFTYFNSPNLWLQMQMPMFNPYMTMPGMGDTFMLQNMYNQGFMMAEQSFFNSDMGMAAQEIASFKKDLETILAQKELPADKKQKLEEIKKLLEETEKKMKALTQSASKQNLQESKNKLAEIKGEIQALKQAATLAVKPEEETSESEETEESQQTEETEQTEQPQQTETPQGETPAAPVSETQAQPQQQQQQPAQSSEPTEAEQKAYAQALNICKDIYVAIDGLGTDEEKLDAAIMSINKDNVVFVMDKWLLSYQDKTGDDSLMETIYDDIFSGDDRKKYTEHILNALKEKADELGIDISPEQAVVESQLGRWWRNDGKIYQSIMDIHAKLTNIPLIDLVTAEEEPQQEEKAA